ncbi:hypothetical protein, partial [Citrobacter freundii]|uniref:hypothetical protein n=1 Tax=Citrobacter freundii TaxID=546 RepID=UPI000FEBE15C
YWYYDRHRSVRLVILVGLAIDQIAQSGLSSLSVIYYSAQLFSALATPFMSFPVTFQNPTFTSPFFHLVLLEPDHAEKFVIRSRKLNYRHVSHKPEKSIFNNL